ncbi:Gfo/Idh/MocA family protein [Rubellimicrobium roseum]|uniref:Gfo/Idh/MocA family oxidoreductase n=1 Tax=Rubellimicrobium roseum TaxID=687525 RepID=A0A5C4NA88_9RHOB|nr:Gfo/Idh/MocA family oxidoreductase [Rubellimicrobium roseum]TNC68250.1 Gfo/Idh/MocA family oxidoreductase [Rubellimicrobium roseum]
MSRPGAAVIGTGFIGTVHLGALRRLGVRVAGVLGSSAGRGRERAAALGVDRAYASLDELLGDPAVDVVHVTSPNHLHYPQVKQILAAGRHVVCEKPLAMTAAESAEMVALARDSGRVAAVCYNVRFYPLNQQARGMVQDGRLGEVRLVTGHYHQDWLAKDTDWNWRLTSEAGGALRAVGDIGTHWVDLTSFVTGFRPTAVLAELSTFIPERHRPLGPVETFAKADDTKTEPVPIATEDAALILLRYPNGARGSLTVSQVSPGRKNMLQWDISGSAASAAWQSETPDHLWIGYRDGPNQILQRDPGLMNALGAAAASLPGGHVEGFADSFFALFRQVYADVEAGGRQPGSTYAGFEDGHYEMRFCEAVLQSAGNGAWADVRD